MDKKPPRWSKHSTPTTTRSLIEEYQDRHRPPACPPTRPFHQPRLGRGATQASQTRQGASCRELVARFSVRARPGMASGGHCNRRHGWLLGRGAFFGGALSDSTKLWEQSSVPYFVLPGRWVADGGTPVQRLISLTPVMTTQVTVSPQGNSGSNLSLVLGLFLGVASGRPQRLAEALEVMKALHGVPQYCVILSLEASWARARAVFLAPFVQEWSSAEWVVSERLSQ